MSQGKGHRAVGEPKEPRRQQRTGGSRANTAAASGQLLASRRKHSHQQQLEAHQAAWDSPDPTHPVHSPRHQPTERAAFCWVIFSTDQSTEAQETTEVFFLNKKTPKTTAYRCQQIGHTEQGNRDPNGEDSWELSEPTDGSQGLARRQKGGREALQAPCYFCESPRQAAQLTQ